MCVQTSDNIGENPSRRFERFARYNLQTYLASVKSRFLSRSELILFWDRIGVGLDLKGGPVVHEPV